MAFSTFFGYSERQKCQREREREKGTSCHTAWLELHALKLLSSNNNKFYQLNNNSADFLTGLLSHQLYNSDSLMSVWELPLWWLKHGQHLLNMSSMSTFSESKMRQNDIRSTLPRCDGDGFSKCILITGCSYIVETKPCCCLCICTVKCVYDLEPGCVCVHRRQSVAGGLQILPLGNNSVFRYHHSRIQIYTTQQEGRIQTGPVQSYNCKWLCHHGHKLNQCRFLTVDKQSGVSCDLLKGVRVRRDAKVNSTVETGRIMQHQRILFWR